MLVNVIASAAIWFVVFVVAVRVFCYAGISENKGGNKVLGWILEKKRSYTSYEPSAKEYVRVAVAAVLFRIVIYLISAAAMRLYLDDATPVNGAQFIQEWLKWDAYNYTRIAELGYGGYQENGMFTTLVFFPLYSWILKAFNFVIPNIYASALVASALCFTVGACYFYGAIALDYGKEIAKKSLIYLSVFPFAFFFGAMMPESTFFMLATACFYYTKKHKWWLVGVTGALACLSRMQGAVLMVVAGVEWMEYYKPFVMLKEKQGKELVKNIFTKAIWIPFMLAGTCIYFYMNYKVTGNPFKFLEYQSAIWGQRAQYFGTTVSEIWNRAFGGEVTGVTRIAVWIPAIVLFILAAVLLLYGMRRIDNKYMAFFVVYVIMNYMPSWLMSSGRYMSVAFPMFLVLAVFSDKHKEADKWIMSVSAVLFGVILMGFLTWKQIM